MTYHMTLTKRPQPLWDAPQREPTKYPPVYAARRVSPLAEASAGAVMLAAARAEGHSKLHPRMTVARSTGSMGGKVSSSRRVGRHMADALRDLIIAEPRRGREYYADRLGLSISQLANYLTMLNKRGILCSRRTPFQKSEYWIEQ